MNINIQIYFVGGYVRDKLLGNNKLNDIDFTFVINKQDNDKISIEDGFKIMEDYLLNENFIIFIKQPSMLTIRAKFPKSGKYKEYFNLTADFVLARKEVYNNKNSRFPSIEIGSLKDDLIRRDFTMNAIALDFNGNYIDLFNGIDDIKNKIIKTPIDPLNTLLDDPLRVLRAIRLSITKDFIIEPNLFKAISNKLVIDKLFKLISKDRIREELCKMFKYSTSKSIKILNEIDSKIPNFINNLFDDNLWLKPTNEKIK